MVLNNISEKEIKAVENQLNYHPQERLGFKTLNQVFYQLNSHLGFLTCSLAIY